MFGLGATELIVILVIALVIFGPGKLPELGGALGRGIRDFRKSVDGIEDKEGEGQTASSEESPPNRDA